MKVVPDMIEGGTEPTYLKPVFKFKYLLEMAWIRVRT